jgi:hypothetical protein
MTRLSRAAIAVDRLKVIDAADTLDIGRESSQEPKVSSGHPDEACYDFREQLIVGECDAGRRPFLFEQFLHLGRIKRSEFVEEANARTKLRKAGNALSMPGMPMRTIPAVPSSKIDLIARGCSSGGDHPHPQGSTLSDREPTVP